MQIPEQTAERAAFEVWFCEDGNYEQEWLDGRVVAGEFLYSNADTENMWQAWLAALATTKATAPVAREDFDKLSADLTRAKNLVVQLHNVHPATRAMIEDATGSWFVWGQDRDAAPPPVEAIGEPVAWSKAIEWGPRQSEMVVKLTRKRQTDHGFNTPLVLATPATPSSQDAPRAEPATVELQQGWVRYEKARRLNPRQWAELHARNLAGETFDDMIDALPAPNTPVPDVAVPAGLSDAQLLDWLEKHGATVEIVKVGPGWSFRVGGSNRTLRSNLRGSIRAALAASAPGAPDLAQAQQGTEGGV